MELEFFISDDDDWAKWHRYWIDWCRNWLLSVGLPASHLSEYNHPKEKLAFYSKGTTDIMFRYPFGVQELWGIAARVVMTFPSTPSSAARRWSTLTRRRNVNTSRTLSSPP